MKRTERGRASGAPAGGAAAARRSWAEVAAVAVAAWLVPGLGHWLLGRRGKAVFFLVLLWGTFAAGWVLSDFRAVFWKRDRIASYGQLGMGVPTVPLLVGRGALASALGLEEIYEPRGASENLLSHYDVGALYTGVAGLMNLVVALSAVGLALGGPPADEPEGEPSRA